MDNLPESQEIFLDNQLADYVDLVLSGADDQKSLEALQSPELAKLQKNILRVKKATSEFKPSAQTTVRMRARMIRDMRLIAFMESMNRLRDRLAKMFAKPSFGLALIGSLVIMIVGIVTTLVPETGPLVGAAGLQGWAAAFILAGIVIIVLLIWRDHRK